MVWMPLSQQLSGCWAAQAEHGFVAEPVAAPRLQPGFAQGWRGPGCTDVVACKSGQELVFPIVGFLASS